MFIFCEWKIPEMRTSESPRVEVTKQLLLKETELEPGSVAHVYNLSTPGG